MAKRVLLHVGTPKTGTTFVQDIMFTNRESLARKGILYPGDRHDAHFLAALDLMGLAWGGLETEAVGAWDALAAEVRAFPGTAVISHEILGHASRLHVERALASLGDAEVHLILSARDLVRQIPAEWQENVKHRQTRTYADFLAEIQDPERGGRLAQWFWAVQELPDVLDRWAATLPPEQVHIVTVPPPGSAKDLLWLRFAEVFGLDPALAPEETRANTSLGVPETELIRRLNKVLNDVVPGDVYRPIVREFLVHRNLSLNTSSPRIALPDDVRAWADARSHAWVEELSRRGYAVVGDLADLEPAPTGATYTEPTEAAIAEAGVRGIAAAVQEIGRLREVEDRQVEEIADLHRELERFRGRRTYQVKEQLVQKADESAVAKAGLEAYRRLRGRNSRET